MSGIFKPLKKSSISILLVQFSLIAAILVGGLLSVILMQKFIYLMNEQQGKNIHNNVSIIKQNLVSQLETYHALLNDKSRTPLLVHALMHPEDYASAAKDFLSNQKIFGKSEMMVLLDFEGRPVAELRQVESPLYSNEEWVEQMLKGDIDSYQDLNAGKAGFFWRLATPVMYQDSPEGILILELPVKRFLNEKVLAGLQGVSLEVNWDGEQAYFAGDVKAKKIWDAHDFLPGAKINFYFDERATRDNTNEMINDLIVIVVIAMILLVVVFVWLGREWFVSPIKELSLMAHAIARGSKYEVGKRYAVAKEYQDLFNDFRNMSDQIENRETRLREQNRALELTQKQLMESQSHLVQSEKMVSLGMVSAGVAHEINNPIGFVKSNLNSLKEYLEYLIPILKCVYQAKVENRFLEKESQENLAELIDKDDLGFVVGDIQSLIKDAINGTIRVQEIVIGLKSFARTNESDDVLFDVNECIRSTLKVVWNEVKYKAKVDLDLQVVPAIKGNPGQINQVIMNLIVNAAQAIDKEGIIKVHTEVSDRNVIVRVTDNGNGIDPKVLGSIFDPFFTTKDVGHGTGLGLSISHGIIESHGGSIKVKSKVGEGTVFTLYFPIPKQSLSEN